MESQICSLRIFHNLLLFSASFDQDEMMNLFKSFVEPYITYCLPVWRGYININSQTKPITNAIKRLKRIITFSKRTHNANNRITLQNLKQYYMLETAETHIHT